MVQKKLRSGYPAKDEVSGRRARDVMPEAIRAASAWRVARYACIRARMLACCAAACKARPAQGLLAIGCGVIETRTRRRLPGSSAKRVRNLLPL